MTGNDLHFPQQEGNGAIDRWDGERYECNRVLEKQREAHDPNINADGAYSHALSSWSGVADIFSFLQIDACVRSDGQTENMSGTRLAIPNPPNHSQADGLFGWN